MAEFDGVSEYHQSGLRRLRDAEELLQPPTLLPNESGAETRHLRGAMYLAGYAVECALKEYLLAKDNAVSLAAWLEKRSASGRDTPHLLSAEGHDITLLISLTDLEQRLDNDTDRKKDWGICCRWKSTWRYDPKTPSFAFAFEFVVAARRFYQWVLRQMD